MEIEIKDVAINFISVEKRMEVAVFTVDGRTINFPFAEYETRTVEAGGNAKPVLYVYARKEEALPTPRIFVFLMEMIPDEVSRQRLEETVL